MGIGDIISDFFGSKNEGPGPAPVYGGSQQAADDAVNRARGMGMRAGQRGGVQVGDNGQSNDYAQSQDTRHYTHDAMGLARAAAVGEVPSAAQLQQSQGIDDAMHAQQTMAASARGGPAAQMAAQRGAAMQGGDMMQRGIANNAILRANEMAQGRQEYGALSGQQRAQDLQSRGMSAQQAQYQASLEDQQRARNDASQQYYEGQANAVGLANLGAASGNQGLTAQANQQNAATNQGNALGLVGSVTSGAGAIFKSDIRAKSDVHAIDPMVERALNRGTPEQLGRYHEPGGETRSLDGELSAIRAQGPDRSAEDRRIDELLASHRASTAAHDRAAARDAYFASPPDSSDSFTKGGVRPSGGTAAALAAPPPETGKYDQGVDSEYAEAFGKPAAPANDGGVQVGVTKSGWPIFSSGAPAAAPGSVPSSVDLKTDITPGNAVVSSLGGEGANGAMWAMQSRLGGINSGQGSGPASSDPRSIGDSYKQFQHDTASAIDRATMLNPGATASTLGNLGVSSDERGKVKDDGKGTIDSMLDAFRDSASTYRYKDDSDQPVEQPKPGARFAGVMAQRVEQVPEIGRSIVTDTPGGKVLEGPALLSALAAGEGRLKQRLDVLERRRA